MSSTQELIRRGSARLFRRAFIKRRLSSTGQYEGDWQEITTDIINWSSIKISSDPTNYNRFRFSGLTVRVANDEGKYNPETFATSLWFNFTSPQRSLFKIEVGYIDQSLGSDGIYTNTEYPQNGGTAASSFVGIIAGDMPTSDQNTVTLPIQPLTEVFRQYPAEALSGYTTTGMTAQKFVESVRDHQDALGNYVFRPFFGNTSTGFDIATTTASYVGLNTAGSGSVVDKSVWDIIEQLAQAEAFVPYVDKEGVFHFAARTPNQTAPTYSFYGLGYPNRDYGFNIKKINKYGLKYSKFYSRVRVKFNEDDTYTSYATVEASLTVAANSLPWLYGHKTVDIDNVWIPNTATAVEIANTVYSEVSNLKDEIDFTAPLIPQLEIFDRIAISYQNATPGLGNLWDVYDWAGTGFETTDTLLRTIAGTTTAVFMGNAATTRFAYQFTSTSQQSILSDIKVGLFTSSSTTGNMVFMLYEGNSLVSASLKATSDSINLANITSTAYDTISSALSVPFSSNDGLTLSANTTYWLVGNQASIASGGLWYQQGLSVTGTPFSFYTVNNGVSWITSTGYHGISLNYLGAVTEGDDILTWADTEGDGINLNESEFRLLSITHNLDNFETKITARKT